MSKATLMMHWHQIKQPVIFIESQFSKYVYSVIKIVNINYFILNSKIKFVFIIWWSVTVTCTLLQHVRRYGPECDSPCRQVWAVLEHVQVLGDECCAVHEAHGSLCVLATLAVLLSHVRQPRQPQVGRVLVAPRWRNKREYVNKRERIRKMERIRKREHVNKH